LMDRVPVKKIYAQAREKTFSSIPLGLSLKIRYSKIQNTKFYPLISRPLIKVNHGEIVWKKVIYKKYHWLF